MYLYANVYIITLFKHDTQIYDEENASYCKLSCPSIILEKKNQTDNMDKSYISPLEGCCELRNALLLI